MAKANLAFTRIGNDGYDYARREDGQWFFREGYFGSYGWAKTKWKAIQPTAEEFLCVEIGLKEHAAGETCFIYGFNSQIIITDGKGLRLP